MLDRRPMSLYESRDSTGEVSLAHMLTAPDDIFAGSDTDVEDIAWLCCRGGWPRGVCIGGDASLEIPFDYVRAICDGEVSWVDGVKRDPRLVRLVLKAYARHISTTATYNTVSAGLIQPIAAE